MNLTQSRSSGYADLHETGEKDEGSPLVVNE